MEENSISGSNTNTYNSNSGISSGYDDDRISSADMVNYSFGAPEKMNVHFVLLYNNIQVYKNNIDILKLSIKTNKSILDVFKTSLQNGLQYHIKFNNKEYCALGSNCTPYSSYHKFVHINKNNNRLFEMLLDEYSFGDIIREFKIVNPPVFYLYVTKAHNQLNMELLPMVETFTQNIFYKYNTDIIKYK